MPITDNLIGARLLGAALGLGLLVACATEPPGTTPVPGVDTPVPTLPPGWTVVASDAGDLLVSLPPWLPAFDATGAVFANEPGARGLELLVEGPRTAEPQPGPLSPERWLLDRIASPGSGLPAADRMVLPAGDSIHVQRLDRSETPLARRIEAWAIATPSGMAYLLVDGPPGAWVGREEDVRLIAQLLRFNHAQSSTATRL